MSDNPQVIRLSGEDIAELVDFLETRLSESVRVTIQDGGLKYADGQGVWSLPFGEDITPATTATPKPSTGCPCTWCTNKPSRTLHTAQPSEF